MLAKALLSAITAALNAYAVHVQWKRETHIDSIEDEIDAIAASSNDATGKLRIKRLLVRKKRYLEQLSSVRSTSDSSD